MYKDCQRAVGPTQIRGVSTACVQVLDLTERQAIRAGADKDQGDPLLEGEQISD